MGAGIHLGDNLSLQIGQGIIQHYGSTGLAYFVIDAPELIRFSSRFESELADEVQWCILCQDGDRKCLAILDKLMGEVAFVQAYGNPRRRRRDLNHRVGDLRIELVGLSGADDI